MWLYTIDGDSLSVEDRKCKLAIAQLTTKRSHLKAQTRNKSKSLLKRITDYAHD
ncbi:MAG: hypothetical protein RMY30_036625 [Nostoc sp. CmiSLP01]|nr:hypothetical protein [Nostoc sp. CmiSLP01]MDZ8284015.1 hypothetical protein [Nostoc sp. ChiSLP01]